MKRIGKKMLAIFICIATAFTLTACNATYRMITGNLEELPSTESADDEFLSEDRIKFRDVKESLALGEPTIERLVAISGMGALRLYPSETNEIRIDYYLASEKEISAEDKDYWEKVELEITQKEKTLVVQTFFPELGKTEPRLKGSQIILDIAVPKTIYQIYVQNNVGYSLLKDVGAQLRVENNVGLVKLENFALQSTAYLYSNVGQIEADFGDLSKAAEIVAVSNVGNINIRMPENADYSWIKSDVIAADYTERLDALERFFASDDLTETWDTPAPQPDVLVLTDEHIGGISVS